MIEIMRFRLIPAPTVDAFMAADRRSSPTSPTTSRDCCDGRRPGADGDWIVIDLWRRRPTPTPPTERWGGIR
jgi:hypothetical protein